MGALQLAARGRLPRRPTRARRDDLGTSLQRAISALPLLFSPSPSPAHRVGAMDGMGDPWPGGDGSLVRGLLPPPTAASDGGSLLPSPLPFPPFHLPNGRVRIPVSLPPNPDFLPVQLDELDVDDELALSGATLDFTLSSLHNSG